MFLQNLPTMNILDPIFYRTLFYDVRPVISPSNYLSGFGCGLAQSQSHFKILKFTLEGVVIVEECISHDYVFND
jgi:hypothetical protein